MISSAGRVMIADTVGQLALTFGFDQRGQYLSQRTEVDAFAGLDRLHAQGDGQMAFAGARRAEQMDHFTARDEVQLRQRQDAVSIQ